MPGKRTTQAAQPKGVKGSTEAERVFREAVSLGVEQVEAGLQLLKRALAASDLAAGEPSIDMSPILGGPPRPTPIRAIVDSVKRK